MNFSDLLKKADINKGMAEYERTDGAVLVDVRTPEEYAEGHIAKSVNIPLDKIKQAADIIENKNTPLFVYCKSGARAAKAVSVLTEMGYANAKNIGGILAYKGSIEK